MNDSPEDDWKQDDGIIVEKASDVQVKNLNKEIIKIRVNLGGKSRFNINMSIDMARNGKVVLICGGREFLADQIKELAPELKVTILAGGVRVEK